MYRQVPLTMPIVYRIYSTIEPRVHYFGVCATGSTEKASLNAEFEELMRSYSLYAAGIPRMINGEPHRQAWQAVFDVMKRVGREMVFIEAVRTWPEDTDIEMVEASLKSIVQAEVDIEWQKKASDNSQCVNVVYRKWPHSNGPFSDLKGKGEYVE